MTPIAKRLAEELLKPKKQRAEWFNANPYWETATRRMLRDAHCFEVSAILPAAAKVQAMMRENWERDGAVPSRLAFLPAPVTWIEFRRPVFEPKFPGAAMYCAVLAWLQDDVCCFDAVTAAYQPIKKELFGWKIHSDAPFPLDGSFVDDGRSEDQLLLYAVLSIINSPAIFERETHAPHKKIAREAKTAKLGELKPWHEIKLSVTRGAAEATGESESGLTGERCLHWVRQHLRFRLGKWELVSNHWRGNAEKGISLARYRVTP